MDKEQRIIDRCRKLTFQDARQIENIISEDKAAKECNLPDLDVYRREILAQCCRIGGRVCFRTALCNRKTGEEAVLTAGFTGRCILIALINARTGGAHKIQGTDTFETFTEAVEGVHTWAKWSKTYRYTPGGAYAA